jgi:hypothetical protein
MLSTGGGRRNDLAAQALLRGLRSKAKGHDDRALLIIILIIALLGGFRDWGRGPFYGTGYYGGGGLGLVLLVVLLLILTNRL